MDTQQHLKSMGRKLNSSDLVKLLQSPASQPRKPFWKGLSKKDKKDFPPEDKPNQVWPGNHQ